MIDIKIIVAIVVTAVVTAVICGLCTRLRRIKQESQTTSEEEIRELVAENEELADDEKRMIHEIIDLGDMKASEAMQPRVDIIAVEDTETVLAALERMQGTGFSRLPLYHDDIDQITGLVHYKDLVPALLDHRLDDPVGKYAYEALYVPETKSLIPLLSEMQGKHQQMALVVDEYGGTGGLITVEDIVEEIVGEITDESDREGTYLRVVREGEWVADGRLPIEDALKMGWPVEESDDYETLAGWLMCEVDSVPQAGTVITSGVYTFKIEGMRRRRIQLVRVKRAELEETPQEESDV